MMPNMEILGSLVQDLHSQFVGLYYLLLPVFFSLAVAIEWTKSGSMDSSFPDIVKRAFISTILLVAFKDIAEGITFIADGIVGKIDDMSGIDSILKMAGEKLRSYRFSPMSILFQRGDSFLSFFSFASYLLLYVTRYVTVAVYYFYWIFLSISAPLLLLFGIFRQTAIIPANLFRSMCEVASWKIVWAIISAMLKALAYGDAFKAEGNYLTLVVLNFVLIIALLCTPLLVRSLVGQGIHSSTPNIIGALTAGALMATKVAKVKVLAPMSQTHSSPPPRPSASPPKPKGTV